MRMRPNRPIQKIILAKSSVDFPANWIRHTIEEQDAEPLMEVEVPVWDAQDLLGVDPISGS